MPSLLAPCGIMCHECEAYLATQANDATAIAAVASTWSQRYGIAFAPEDIWCDGCTNMSERTERHCRECPVRPCAKARGFTTCAACTDYPCPSLSRVHRLLPEARRRLDTLHHNA